MLKKVFPFFAKGKDDASQMWARRFLELGERLKVKVPDGEAPAELRRAS
jgi:hypothetical protein